MNRMTGLPPTSDTNRRYTLVRVPTNLAKLTIKIYKGLGGGEVDIGSTKENIVVQNDLDAKQAQELIDQYRDAGFHIISPLKEPTTIIVGQQGKLDAAHFYLRLKMKAEEQGTDGNDITTLQTVADELKRQGPFEIWSTIFSRAVQSRAFVDEIRVATAGNARAEKYLLAPLEGRETPLEPLVPGFVKNAVGIDVPRASLPSLLNSESN